ncbi:MAG TPA: glycosyltransferase, partial [Polyangiales bacterium]|nr:glycosyltransferase [Polyangiales bacterium]
MRALDIAFFGSSLVSSYWNGAATYYRGVLRALSRRGHRITFYEPDAYGRQQHRDMPDPDWARVVVYPAHDDSGALRALDEAASADLIVKASGVGVFDSLLEAAVLALAKPRALVVFWDVDAPATLERLQQTPSDPFHTLLPHYDAVLTYGGGAPVVAAYRAFGARECVPIYNALDPETHHPAPPSAAFEADLGFMASRLPDREARVEEFFFRAAQLAPARRFLLGGVGWEGRALPDNVHYAGHVYTRDHNAFNATPTAVLNVNRDSMARFGFSPPTRVFEAAGAGACLISDRWPGIEAFLEPEREVLIADDGEQVAEHVARLSPSAARAIGEAARRRVLAEHTYLQR